MFTKRNLLIYGAGFIAMVVVFIAAFDWSGGENTATNKVIVRAPKQSKTVSKVAPHSSATAQAPSAQAEAPQAPGADKPEEDAVSVPEPPKVVTYEEAEATFHERRYHDAVELFKLYVDRKSKNPWGYYMLGLSAWKAGDPEVAETAFTRALELDPRHVKSWLNLSRVLLDTNRPNEALARITEALAIDPESNVAYRLQGRAFHQLGQREEAVGAYHRAIQIDDQDAWSMNNMGLIFIEEERFDEALPPLARAVELRGDIAIFLNNLGMVLEHMEHFRAAEEMYKSAVTIDETYEKASANLARVAAVSEDPGLEPVDLGAIARSFTDEIESRRVAAAGGERPELIAPETDIIAVIDADSIFVSDAGIGVTDSTGNLQE